MIRSVLDGLYLIAGYAAGLFLIAIFLLMMSLSLGRQVGINVPAGDDSQLGPWPPWPSSGSPTPSGRGS